ncbi:hypothetical protein [Mesorhizobium sp. ANAO-SY3R2]|uniref:hypothetical protein n=1 Tax=Mesorhizobium sp. ANAO-SY3R2 TaxID=3166644 RepID=UPI003672160C
MSRVARAVFAAVFGLGTAMLGAVPAQAGAFFGKSPYAYNNTSVCGEAWVLNQISNRFRYQVRHVPNLPDVAITNFSNIQENSYLPNDENHPIARVYCVATVTLSDGDDRPVWYLIEYGMGFASIGNNVEFCVAGFDRWYVYNGGGDDIGRGGCRVLR